MLVGRFVHVGHKQAGMQGAGIRQGQTRCHSQGSGRRIDGGQPLRSLYPGNQNQSRIMRRICPAG